MKSLFIVISIVVLYRQAIEFSLTIIFFSRIVYYTILIFKKLGTLALVIILLCTIRKVL